MKKVFTLFTFTMLLITACSSNKDKELFDSASAKAKAKNYSEALKDYQKIIDEYSSSDQAAESYFAIAAMYHMYQIPNISNEESLKKAVSYYHKLFEEFPDNEKAAKALFMAAFIEANDLNQIDKARNSYQAFLSEYPNHELASQAKLEVSNLGKTPEEILQNKAAAK
ncbi:MAG: tetratricopeptide repeat protein [Melioribacteraceae bacterium]